jgi:aminopeptidase N
MEKTWRRIAEMSTKCKVEKENPLDIPIAFGYFVHPISHECFLKGSHMRFIMATLICLLSVASSQERFSLRDPGEAPNRTYDVLHYKIEVTLHEKTKSLDGRVSTTLVPLLPDLNAVTFNAGQMSIKSVSTSKGTSLKFSSTPWTLTINLDKSYSYRDTLVLITEYSCTPKEGLTFNNTDGALPTKRAQIWSQGEDTTNHFWFPCYDFPNDKSTSEVIGTVNSKYSFLSNGKLLSVKENKQQGTKTYHWRENKPHSSYLIMIAAGEFAILRDSAGKLPLEYYVYPDDTTNARESFKVTPSMIEFFNKATGFPYPWEKYAQIILQDHFGGMENTSATTLSDTWAVPDARARLDNSPSSLIAHELAHQWWGDVVTCKDFRHMWLNESFASYYDPLYFEFTLGRDEFDYTMYENQRAGIRVDTTRGRKPIVSIDSYGENIYPRGSSVLHMLRFILGDDLYHRAIRHYITKHQFQPVETNDLKVAIEEETGQNLQWFFDEWVYRAGHPIFDVSYRWDESTKQVALSVKQTQVTDSLTGIFRMPVDVEITTRSGVTTHRIGILTQDSTYLLSSNDKPLLVIFDKGNWLLKQLRFAKPFEEWKYQAMSARNPVDRYLAVVELSRMPSGGDVVSVLEDRIRNDKFWAVRREAVLRAAQLAGTSDSLKSLLKPALIVAANDEKPQVRSNAISALRSFRSSDVAAVMNSALSDSSYSVLTSALYGLAKVDSTHALGVVKQYLNYPSRQGVVSNTALNAFAQLDSVGAMKVALDRLGKDQIASTRGAALRIVRRYGKGRVDAMTAVKNLLQDPDNYIKFLSVQTLGDIGDASVLPLLEPIANDKENSASGAAKQSMEKIQKREMKGK